MASFDLDAAITEFLADPDRNSLELPHMTTGQRKKAKKVLEQYPHLQCESFGFGAERQLHLFKKSTSETHKEDDPVARIASPGRSTLEPSSTTGSVADCSPSASDVEPSLPLMHEELQVRNTFIHIESAPVDERAVQSMPHGMFRQCIISECLQAAAHDIPAFPTTPSSVSSEPEMEPMVEQTGRLLPFSVGTLVVVEGLVKAPAFNGRSAVVQGWDETTGRYDIVIASPSGCQQAKIKEENLRMVLPCPQ